jgi:sister chromatid cohesion protein PDS5
MFIKQSDFMKIVEKDLPSAATTLQMRLRRSSLWLINTSSIPTLLDIATSSSSSSRTSSPAKTPKSKSNGNVSNTQASEVASSQMVEASRIILLFISKNCPQLYYSHLPRLAKEMHANKSSDSLETVLRALAAVACLGTDQSPNDR